MTGQIVDELPRGNICRDRWQFAIDTRSENAVAIGETRRGFPSNGQGIHIAITWEGGQNVLWILLLILLIIAIGGGFVITKFLFFVLLIALIVAVFAAMSGRSSA